LNTIRKQDGDAEGAGPVEAAWSRRPVLFLVLLGLAGWMFFFFTSFNGITENDGYGYASMARNILRGDGAIKDTFNPVTFALYPDGQVRTRESIRAFPFPKVLFPLLLIPSLLVFGYSDFAIALVCSLFYLLAIPLVYRVARLTVGIRAAALATVLYLFSANVMYYTVSGVTEPVYVFLLFAALAAILDPSGLKRMALAAGLFLGFMYILKDVAIVYAVGLAVFAAVTWRKDKLVARLMLLAIGVAAILILGQALSPVIQPPRSASAEQTLDIRFEEPEPGVVSDPAYGSGRTAWQAFADRWLSRLLIFSPVNPGHTHERSLDAGLGRETVLSDPSFLAEKFKRNVLQAGRILFYRMTTVPVLVLFWIGGWLLWKRIEARRLFVLVLSFLGIQAVICTVFFTMSRYFHPFVPLVGIVASGALYEFLDRLKIPKSRLRTAVVVLAALVMLYPFCPIAGIDHQARFCAPRCYLARFGNADLQAELGAFLRQHTGPDDVVVCDAPWISAWNGDRTSIWLPNDMQTMKRMQRRVQVDWLFITFRYWRNLGPWKAWLLGFEGRDTVSADGFTFRAAYRTGDTAAYLFRADLMQEYQSRKGGTSPEPGEGS